MKKILLVNPWIYDFAAYDYWLKPWGFLKISSILKKSGFEPYFIDLLDRHHPLITQMTEDLPGGTGKYPTEEIKRPDVLKDIPRKYKRYGLPVRLFKEVLPREKIDLILVSSGMTYWYPGVFEVIKILKAASGKTPIVLGGTYATLSYEHALEKSGADHVIKNKEIHRLPDILGKECDFSFQSILDETIDYEWYKDPGYAVLRISLGCPFNCRYCAQKLLGPDFMLKDKKKALEEITWLYQKGIRNFAFYDDALLFDGDYIRWYLEAIIRKGIEASFYTPNGLHARFITRDLAGLLKKVNFVNPMLSLETASREKEKAWHRKVTREELEEAIFNLKEAGYKSGEYTVYLMIGVPGSDLHEVEEGIDFAHSLGAKISLSEFSPVSGTEMAKDFEKARQEPLLQNNSVFPSFSLSEWKRLHLVKDKARRLNSGLKSHTREAFIPR